VILDAQGHNISERHITTIIKGEGFARLPRRSHKVKTETMLNLKNKIIAPKSKKLDPAPDEFSTNNAGLLCLLPYFQQYGLDKIIENSGYPSTTAINRQSSIYCFIA
jgi:hypothetical protein